MFRSPADQLRSVNHIYKCYHDRRFVRDTREFLHPLQPPPDGLPNPMPIGLLRTVAVVPCALVAGERPAWRQGLSPATSGVGGFAWPIWLPPHHSTPSRGGLGGEREARRTHMAAGGSEGSCKTTKEEPALAEWRVLRRFAAGASKPRLVLRLRREPDP